MANKGYFIITDISGYTEYLTRSELDHATKSCKACSMRNWHTLVPFAYLWFSRTIFLYVPETDFINSQSLVEVLENLYIVFETLQQMQLNTTCTCRACKNMKLLFENVHSL
jgi:hypothetical protein